MRGAPGVKKVKTRGGGRGRGDSHRWGWGCGEGVTKPKASPKSPKLHAQGQKATNPATPPACPPFRTTTSYSWFFWFVLVFFI